jgi:hypothetical protein
VEQVQEVNTAKETTAEILYLVLLHQQVVEAEAVTPPGLLADQAVLAAVAVVEIIALRIPAVVVEARVGLEAMLKGRYLQINLVEVVNQDKETLGVLVHQVLEEVA